MALPAAAVVYFTAGGLVCLSGVKGSTIAHTVKGALTGNLGGLPDDEPITFDNTTAADAAGGSGTSAVSGSAEANYVTIANYLVGNGYSKAGAAGVVGCIAGESGGNPEAEASKGNPRGGAGLIQWTGTSYDQFKPQITGNASKDLDQQLPLIVAYNNAQGAGLVTMLNALTDPVQAADFYSSHFERPAVTDSDVRADVARSVYSSITKGSTTGTTTTTTKNGVTATQYTSPNGYSY